MNRPGTNHPGATGLESKTEAVMETMGGTPMPHIVRATFISPSGLGRNREWT